MDLKTPGTQQNTCRQINQHNCSARSFCVWRNKASRAAPKPCPQKLIIFPRMPVSVFHPFCPLPSSISDKSLRDFWTKELDATSPCLPLSQVLYPSAKLWESLQISSRHMKGKKSCSITVSHLQHTITPSKLEDSPVIFHLQVYNSSWGITCALSLPSRIKRSVYSSMWDRDFKQRKSLAYPR